MKILISMSLAAFTAMTSAALAACPSSVRNSESFNFHSGDQRVSASWLQKNLAGKKVHFADGTEAYGKDGSYAYEAGGKTYKAPAYRFYDSGMRCIDYPNARFDMYVVNNGKLILINAGGGRYEAKKIR